MSLWKAGDRVKIRDDVSCIDKLRGIHATITKVEGEQVWLMFDGIASPPSGEWHTYGDRLERIETLEQELATALAPLFRKSA